MAMSSVARKRRSEVQQQTQQPTQITYNPNPNAPPPMQSQSQPPSSQPSKPMGTGLTLPQVISVIDNRLIHLESFVKEQQLKEQPNNNTKSLDLPNSELPFEIMDEVQTRFDILAREISELKDVVLKLQSFTMEVNKALLEERIHILSDLDQTTAENSGANFALSENASASMT